MSDVSKAKATLILVSAGLLVAIVVYGIQSGRLREIKAPGGVSVTLSEVEHGPTSVVQGQEVRQRQDTPEGSGGGHIDIVIPTRGPLPLSEIHSVYVVPPSDDHQLRHTELIVDMLNTGHVNQLYEETDNEGKLSTWITMRTLYEGERCFNYTTLYEKFAGEKEVAFRLACPKADGGWTSQMEPSFVKAMENSPS